MSRNLYIAGLLTIVGVLLFTGCSDSIDNNSSTSSSDVGYRKNRPTVLTIQCDSFSGIQHCTLGNTSLSLQNSSSVLSITGFASADTDGAEITLDDAIVWASEGTYYLKSGVGNNLNFFAKSGGNTISTLFVSQISNTDSFQFSPNFTGSSGNCGKYTIQVYYDTSLVGTQSDIATCSNVYVSAGSCARAQNEISTLFRQTPQGKSEWTFIGDTITNITLPNTLTYIGNKIIITEQLIPGQNLYYSFEGIEIKADIDSLHITSESVTR